MVKTTRLQRAHFLAIIPIAVCVIFAVGVKRGFQAAARYIGVELVALKFFIQKNYGQRREPHEPCPHQDEDNFGI